MTDGYQAQPEPDRSGWYLLLGFAGWILWGLFITGLAYRQYPDWYREDGRDRDVKFEILTLSILLWPVTVVTYAGNQVLDYVDQSKAQDSVVRPE